MSPTMSDYSIYSNRQNYSNGLKLLGRLTKAKRNITEIKNNYIEIVPILFED